MLAPCSVSQSSLGAAAPAALSTAWCAIAATWSIAGLALLAALSAASTIESTTACALKEALFTAPYVSGNIPAVGGVLSRAMVSM